MQWDLFCRVIDNFGDIGLCWRLAAALARRGQQVRLWLDDASALAWMAPRGAAGVELRAWTDAAPAPGAVVIEAFGCDPPAAFVAAMAQQQPPPVWINLEYLSAEPAAERLHGLPSPQSVGAAAGLVKWFYYPGFTAASGGLLHDLHDIAPPDSTALPAEWAVRPGEQRVSVFCYDNPELPALVERLARQAPTLLLAAPGAAMQRLAAAPLPAGVRLLALPWLSQPGYDRLLAGCDLNIVRGEDSFVRAQLASAQPFVWQIYSQRDGVHAAKLQAFVDRYLAAAPAGLAAVAGATLRAFNGLVPWPTALPDPGAWTEWHRRWRAGLLAQTDLVTRLLRFVGERRTESASVGRGGEKR